MPLPDPGPIESARLLLRPVDAADLPSLLLVNGDDAVTRFLPYATWRTMADAEAWLERATRLQASGLGRQLVVVERATSFAIGTLLLFRFEEGSALAEIGYVMGRPHWGRGFMREALHAFLACAYTRLGLRRIEAQIDPRNVRSAALVRSLGFTHEGLLRQRWVAKGEARDVDMFGLLSHEWADGAGRIEP